MPDQPTSSENRPVADASGRRSDPTPEVATAMRANAYAVTYRLLGSADAAGAAADEAVRVTASESSDLLADPAHRWLAPLAAHAVEASARTAAESQPDGGDGAPLPRPAQQGAVAQASLREALRRRLANATDRERAAGALVHLAAYDPTDVARILDCSTEEAVALAGVIAPPPSVDYRSLGDPDLVGPREAVRRGRSRRGARRPRVPHWSTILAAIVVVVMVIAATQCTGPRPTLGPEADENSWHAEQLSGTEARSPS